MYSLFNTPIQKHRKMRKWAGIANKTICHYKNIHLQHLFGLVIIRWSGSSFCGDLVALWLLMCFFFKIYNYLNINNIIINININNYLNIIKKKSTNISFTYCREDEYPS